MRAHFIRLALPAAVGMGFSTAYNVVDVYFAGLISSRALAALAVSFQPFFLLAAFAIGLGTAMSALVGNAVGARRRRKARKLALQGLGYGAAGGLTLVLVGALLAQPLMSITTDPGEVREIGTGYFLILLLSLPGFVIAQGANGVLQALGDTKSYARGLIIAFVANIALNPVLAFGIPGVWGGMGLHGIALASVITQSWVGYYLMRKIWRVDLTCAPALREFIPSRLTAWAVSAQALPSATTMFVLVFSGFVVLYALRGFGEAAQAAFSIALRIEQLALLPAIGFTIALVPIVAQNFGAKEFDRVHLALKTCLGLGLIYMALACPVMIFGAYWFMGLFTDDPEVARIGVSYLRIDGAILPVYLALFSLNSLLQGLKKPVWAFWIGVYRQGLAVPVFIYLCVALFDIGVTGVWIGQATSVITGLMLAALVAQRVTRPMMGGLFGRARAPTPL